MNTISFFQQEKYLFCYEVIHHYLKAFDDYNDNSLLRNESIPTKPVENSDIDVVYSNITPGRAAKKNVPKVITPPNMPVKKTQMGNGKGTLASEGTPSPRGSRKMNGRISHPGVPASNSPRSSPKINRKSAPLVSTGDVHTAGTTGKNRKLLDPTLVAEDRPSQRMDGGKPHQRVTASNSPRASPRTNRKSAPPAPTGNVHADGETSKDRKGLDLIAEGRPSPRINGGKPHTASDSPRASPRINRKSAPPAPTGDVHAAGETTKDRNALDPIAEGRPSSRINGGKHHTASNSPRASPRINRKSAPPAPSVNVHAAGETTKDRKGLDPIAEGRPSPRINGGKPHTASNSPRASPRINRKSAPPAPTGNVHAAGETTKERKGLDPVAEGRPSPRINGGKPHTASNSPRASPRINRKSAPPVPTSRAKTAQTNKKDKKVLDPKDKNNGRSVAPEKEENPYQNVIVDTLL